MNTSLKRKVKRKPAVIHQVKKVVNSQDKSLHRSILSHSYNVTGYKTKISALLSNNKALAQALEITQMELNARSKLCLELQQKLAMKSPKTFKSKLQKVCEHLHVIVALLQEVMAECDDQGEAPENYENTDQNNLSYGVADQNEYSNNVVCHEELLGSVNVDAFGNGNEEYRHVNSRIMKGVTDMSPIVEQSALIFDEDLPPLLFSEDLNQDLDFSNDFVNVNTKPRSKSKSTSLPNKQRSKQKSISPKSQQNSPEINGEISSVFNSDNTDNIQQLSPKADWFDMGLSPKENKRKSSSSPLKSRSPANSTNIPSKLPSLKSPKLSLNKKSSIPKKKANKKHILLVKLPHTPKRTILRNEVSPKSPRKTPKSRTSPLKILPDRRKTFTIAEDKKKVRRETIVISKSAKENVSNNIDRSSTDDKDISKSNLSFTESNEILPLNIDSQPSNEVISNTETSPYGLESINENERLLWHTSDDDKTCTLPQDVELSCQNPFSSTYHQTMLKISEDINKTHFNKSSIIKSPGSQNIASKTFNNLAVIKNKKIKLSKRTSKNMDKQKTKFERITNDEMSNINMEEANEVSTPSKECGVSFGSCVVYNHFNGETDSDKVNRIKNAGNTPRKIVKAKQPSKKGKIKNASALQHASENKSDDAGKSFVQLDSILTPVKTPVTKKSKNYISTPNSSLEDFVKKDTPKVAKNTTSKRSNTNIHVNKKTENRIKGKSPRLLGKRLSSPTGKSPTKLSGKRQNSPIGKSPAKLLGKRKSSPLGKSPAKLLGKRKSSPLGKKSPAKLLGKRKSSPLGNSPTKLSGRRQSSPVDKSPITFSRKRQSTPIGKSPTRLSEKRKSSPVGKSPTKLSKKGQSTTPVGNTPRRLSGNKQNTSISSTPKSRHSVSSTKPKHSPKRSEANDAQNCNEDGRKRRAATYVSYKEPPLGKKLRQGDPFTSNVYKNDVISQGLRTKKKSCKSRKSKTSREST